MELDPGTCYRAMASRDARFDGRFFVTVLTTGIYCRPICPAPNPRPENCRFVASAAAAEEAGFRPCLRCRPETSPGTPAWSGTSATVSRGLRLIAEGALDTGGVEQLAGRLGVGTRHLRRLFATHLGASPVAVAQTQRVQLGKRLIDETDFPMSEVAYSAGFASVRRFNEAIARTYGRPPRALRRHSGPETPPGPAEGLTVRLAYRPPFRWDALLRFLGPRAIPGVEAVAEDRYARSFTLDGTAGVLEAREATGSNHLIVGIRLSRSVRLTPVVERLRRLFDLGADPAAIDPLLVCDPMLAPLVAASPGLRVPGAFDGFELGVRAVLGQQVSVAGATTLIGRLVERFGAPLAMPDLVMSPGGVDPGLTRLFPTPERLADADVAAIGMPKARARAVGAFARAVASGGLRLDGSLDLNEAVGRLGALPGFGPWTAHYIAMRALGEPDAFPASDLGLLRAAARMGTPLDAGQLARRADRWRPWRAYGAMHLWNSGSAARRVVGKEHLDGTAA